MTTIVKVPLSRIEIQLTGETCTTPICIEFSSDELTIRFDALYADNDNHYFTVTYRITGNKLIEVKRDYHGNPNDTGERPVVSTIHEWN